MRLAADPIEAALREADLEAEQVVEEKLTAVQSAEDWRWLMSHPQGRRIARRLISSSQRDDEFTPNFGHMAWKQGRASLVRQQLVEPMRASSLELFHAMEREDG